MFKGQFKNVWNFPGSLLCQELFCNHKPSFWLCLLGYTCKETVVLIHMYPLLSLAFFKKKHFSLCLLHSLFFQPLSLGNLRCLSCSGRDWVELLGTLGNWDTPGPHLFSKDNRIPAVSMDGTSSESMSSNIRGRGENITHRVNVLTATENAQPLVAFEAVSKNAALGVGLLLDALLSSVHRSLPSQHHSILLIKSDFSHFI